MDDLEVSAARRPPGRGWWVDGRCGSTILATLVGVVLFSLALSLRREPEAAEQAPAFMTVIVLIRLLSYAWLGCVLAPLDWALRRIWVFLSVLVVVDLLLLAHATGFGVEKAILSTPAFGSTGLRVTALLSLLVLLFALTRSMTGSFKAGVETTRLYGRVN